MNKRILFFAVLVLTAGITNEVQAQTGEKYPYVTTIGTKKCVIVSRDDKGGVKATALHANWTTTPAHIEKDEPDGTAKACNAPSAKFEVYASDNSTSSTWTAAPNKCPSGWRLPTQRELMLMYVMKDQLTGITSFTGYTYWSATEYSGASGNAWFVTFSNGRTYSNAEAGSLYVRCIRDL